MAGSKSRSLSGFLPVLLVLLAAAAYANSMQGAFVFDDLNHITRNPRVQQLFPLGATLSGRRPTLDLSLAINYAIGGKDTTGYHIVNLAIHILAGLTLFGIVRRTLRAGGERSAHSSAASWLAGSIAAIWLVHPLQTQSVTYIVQRSESLMGLCYLLTLYCTIRAASHHSAVSAWRWYVPAIVACALGMGSKAVMVTAPVVVLLYDAMFLSSSIREALRRRWPLYAGLALTWGVIVWSGVFRGIMMPSEGVRATVGFGYKGITALEYARTQPGVLLHYLRLAVLPNPLCLDYKWPVAQSGAAMGLPALAVLGLLAGTVWAVAGRRAVGFAGAWFFLILAPTSSFVPIKDAAFEHRMYLPLAAVLAVGVVGAYVVLLRILSALPRGGFARAIPAGMVVLATASLTLGTVRRNGDYRSEVTMWKDVVTTRPDNHRAFYNLGVAQEAERRLDDAIESYRRSVELEPSWSRSWYNFGVVLASKGVVEEAVAAYEKALAIRPGDTDAHLNLGSLLLSKNEFGAAIEHFREVLRIDPDHADAQYNLGNALSKKGDHEAAAAAFTEAARLNPGDASTHYNLGNTLSRLGRRDEAERSYRRALQVNPDHAFARYRIGIASARAGRHDEAIQAFRKVVDLKPKFASAHYRLGNALVDDGQRDQGVAALREALRLKPDHAKAKAALEAAQRGDR